MSRRVISAAVGAPLVFAVAWSGEPWFSLVVAAVAIWAAIEFYRMAPVQLGLGLTVFGVLWSLLFLANAHLPNSPGTSLLITSSAILPLVWLVLGGGRGSGVGCRSQPTTPESQPLTRDPRPATRDLQPPSPGLRWAWTLAGILYVGWFLGHFVSLRALADGRGWVILALFSTFAADTAAFFVGRAWGRRRLSPSISPGKTWEGAVAGFLAAIVAAVVLSLLLGLRASYLHVLVIGGLVGVFGQFGDLAESLLKRSAGVKDAGSLIPGHGGILDRLDSVVFSVVVVYYYLVWAVV